MSEAALIAWRQQFSSDAVELPKDAPGPFELGRRLGGGGNGVVYETMLGGIPVALKLTYSTCMTDRLWNEIKILGQISKQRHRHIVELIGAYSQRQRSNYEIGLLIWPIATTDMAAFLQDIDYLGDWLGNSEANKKGSMEDLDSAIENLAALLNPNKSSTDLDLQSMSMQDLGSTYSDALRFLRQTFGCTATAVAWLHRQGIRHKDIKPSQILLSSKGLWLTDFGWSKDVSDLTHGTTSGRDRMTPRYHAPERAERGRCGKAEDIFALGCTFLEMGTRLSRRDFRTKIALPWTENEWTFHGNLGQINRWFKPFHSPNGKNLSPLGSLITEMLSHDQRLRPSSEQVVHALLQIQHLSNEANSDHSDCLFFKCCRSAPSQRSVATSLN